MVFKSLPFTGLQNKNSFVSSSCSGDRFNFVSLLDFEFIVLLFPGSFFVSVSILVSKKFWVFPGFDYSSTFSAHTNFIAISCCSSFDLGFKFFLH